MLKEMGATGGEVGGEYRRVASCDKKEDSGCQVKNRPQGGRGGSRKISYKMVSGVLAMS